MEVNRTATDSEKLEKSNSFIREKIIQAEVCLLYTSSKIYRKGDTFVSVKIDFERLTYEVFIIYMDLNI